MAERSVSIAEARAGLSGLVKEAEEGEVVQITRWSTGGGLGFCGAVSATCAWAPFVRRCAGPVPRAFRDDRGWA